VFDNCAGYCSASFFIPQMTKTFRIYNFKWWIFIAVAGGLLSGVAVGIVTGLTRDLPQIRSLEAFVPSAVTRIYSSDKEILAEFYREKRNPVPLDIIPTHIKNALISTEDRQFYRHSGVDLKAVARAIIKDIWAGEFVEGASTISQQLAKTLFLTPRKTLVRKIKEATLAFQLERRYTKDEILTFYLNQVYFGSGAYGVASAAEIFFGKPVHELTLAECALIAGMPKSPSRYSPLVNPELSVTRRNIVLKQMVATGVITPADYTGAVEEPLTTAVKSTKTLKAPYFVEYVRKQLEEIVGPARLYREGLTVFTTLSFRHQLSAEAALADGMAAIEDRMMNQGIENSDLQGSLLALRIDDGSILAMVGGRNFVDSPFNRAVDARRQPGSAFKPIVYASAIEQGFSQGQLILDAPVAFKGAGVDQDWQPQNFSKTYDGEITLRYALTHSKNIPAVRLVDMLGPSAVVRFAHSLGISSPLADNLTLALGSSGISLLELTATYAAFANHGQWVNPWGIMEILDSKGRTIWRVKPLKRVVMSRAAAAIMADMLVGVIQEGTGKQASVLKRPLAGKTGTTDEYRDALFIGFSPSIAAGAWVGKDRFGSLGDRETGARAALPIWLAYMKNVLADQPVDYFDIPDDVVRLFIDPVSGETKGPGWPGAVVAMFKKGVKSETAP
jgi:penicillin-binding protein 1A